jgi:hypothetical protein
MSLRAARQDGIVKKLAQRYFILKILCGVAFWRPCLEKYKVSYHRDMQERCKLFLGD